PGEIPELRPAVLPAVAIDAQPALVVLADKKVATAVAVEVADEGGRMPVAAHIQRLAVHQHRHGRPQLVRSAAVGRRHHQQASHQAEDVHGSSFLVFRARTRPRSQTRAVWSVSPVMRYFPSGESDRACGPERRSDSTAIGFIVTRSSSRTSPLARPKPMASRLPSTENATGPALEVGISSSLTTWPVASSTMQTG